MYKLNLQTTPHPRPYRLRWLSEDEEIKVTNQVFLSFSIGKYKDEVLCHVVPMEACHVLFRITEEYDRHVYHDGLTNKFSFERKEMTYLHTPLTPKEVRRDQIVMKESKDKQMKHMKAKGMEDKESLIASHKEVKRGKT